MSFFELLFGFTPETKAAHPYVFANNSIDRRKCTRTVPLKVLSLGMSRTGTASMQAALQTLGYPTYHGFDMHANPQDCDMWAEAFDVKFFSDRTPDQVRAALDTDFFDKLLGHVSATTDTPSNAFGPELIAAYPDAKVVLVERDIETWYVSFERALIQSMENPLIPVFMRFIPSVRPMAAVGEGIRSGHFGANGNGDEYRRRARDVYRAHYAEMREILKDQPGRLLEYRLGSGWEPLCEFLGVPVPEGDFPRINEKAKHDEFIRIVMIKWTRICVGRVLQVGVPLLVAWFGWKYYAR